MKTLPDEFQAPAWLIFVLSGCAVVAESLDLIDPALTDLYIGCVASPLNRLGWLAYRLQPWLQPNNTA